MVDLKKERYMRLETTFSDESDARDFVDMLLRDRLIGCAQMINIKSMYWWKGSVENDHEILLILKFRKENLNEVLERFKNHRYELPEITVNEIAVSEEYGKWLDSI